VGTDPAFIMGGGCVDELLRLVRSTAHDLGCDRDGDAAA